MVRRGEAATSTLVWITIAIVLMVLLVIPIYRSNAGFRNSLSCEGEAYQCVGWFEGCPSGYENHLQGILIGCKGIGMCCANQEALSASLGGSSGGPKIDRTSLEVRHGTNLAPLSSTLTVIPENPPSFTITGQTGAIAETGVTWKADVSATDEKGQPVPVDVSPIQTDLQSKLVTVAKDGKEFAVPVDKLEFPSSLQGKIVQITISIYPTDATVKTLEGALAKWPTKVAQQTIRFQVKAAVRYVGLSSTWSQSKTITAGCDGVTCKAIAYQIVPADAKECVAPTNVKDIASLPTLPSRTQYCIWKEGKVTEDCYETQMACDAVRLGGTDTLDSEEFLNLLIDQNIIDEQDIAAANLATQFSSDVAIKSNPKCVKDVQDQVIAETDGLFKAENFESTRDGRGTFVLDRPFMQGKALCVYGWDGTKLYSSGPPQAIKVDLTPPQASIEFKKLSLKTIFYCIEQPSDTESGCVDTYGVSYVSSLKNFFPALAQGKTQNAEAWCPQSGYASTTKNEMPYTYDELRVMCLRVQDKAGNYATAMTPVYNTYKALQAAIEAAK